ncbi:MAG: hypothetical protein QOE25_669 [Actinomycetota bacterium]|jgi:hypothetical protein|nr:hypothetical protein [Actinomycetota bacterium]
MDRRVDSATVLGAVGGAAMIGGAFLPWAASTLPPAMEPLIGEFGLRHTSYVKGTSIAEAVVVVTCGALVVVFSLLPLGWGSSGRAAACVLLIASTLATGLITYDLYNIGNAEIRSLGFAGPAPTGIRPGWGLFLSFGGGGVAILGGLLLLRRSPTPAPRVAVVAVVVVGATIAGLSTLSAWIRVTDASPGFINTPSSIDGHLLLVGKVALGSALLAFVAGAAFATGVDRITSIASTALGSLVVLVAVYCVITLPARYADVEVARTLASAPDVPSAGFHAQITSSARSGSPGVHVGSGIWFAVLGGALVLAGGSLGLRPGREPMPAALP